MARPLFDTDAVHFASLPETCPVVPGAVVSKPLINTDAIKQIMFSMDAGQELADHQAPFVATVHVLDGRLDVTVDGDERAMGPGDWVVLPPDARHALVAREGTRFMLTLVR